MKKSSLVFLLVLIGQFGFSQATNVSPYSRYALGDINPGWFAQNTAMGGATVAMVDSFQVNVLNPASYCFTAFQSPVLDISLRGRFINLSTNAASTKANYFHMNNIVLTLPVTRRFGAALGLLPFSTSGYNITFSEVNETVGGTVSTFYQGQGGINRVFLGLSGMPVRTKTNMFSVGANFSYLFGDLQKTRKLIFPNETGLFNSKIINSIYARDFMVDAGIYYRHIVSPRQQLSFGFSTSLGTSLKCDRSVLAHTIAPVSEAFVDTVLYIESEKGTVFIPPRYSAGLTYDFKGVPGSKNNYKLTLSAQYNFQDWSKYEEDFPSSVYTDTLNGTSGINFGVQFIPHVLGVGSGKVNPFKLVNYRAGFYTNKNYLNIDTYSINSWGVTCGLGIPLWASSLSYSMVNISFEYGARGTTANNLLLEKYTGFHIGFAFCPSRVDRWFVKRKYD
jgi:hypothetical protein